MSMNDVNLPLPHQLSKGVPRRQVEGVALLNLEVIDAELGCPAIDLEGAVTSIAKVANRHVKAAGIGTGRAQENGLFRSAAGAANAAKL
jgi:hypothetical protein